MESNTAIGEAIAPIATPPTGAKQRPAAPSTAARLPFIDAMRAVVAQMIVWHHFALCGPLWEWAAPNAEMIVEVLRNHRWAVHIFFIISGYLIERTMASRTWTLGRVRSFLVRRYCRLGFPYLAAFAIAMAANAFSRGWLPESLIGPRPTLAQVAAHLVFLQDILGYESLSAGLWFVCIEFQLGLLYALMLWSRDALGGPQSRWGRLPTVVAWALALASLFYFNVHQHFDPWAIYYFGHFFLGVLIFRGLERREAAGLFWLYALAMAAALAYDWRWRLATSLGAGLILFGAGKTNLLSQWPNNRVVAYLGRTSYSLFLVHFPVLLIVSTICLRNDWSTQPQAIVALLGAYIASLAVADMFYRAIEQPTAELSKKIG